MIKLNKKIVILIFSLLMLFSCNDVNNESIVENNNEDENIKIVKNISEKDKIKIKEEKKIINEEIINIDKPEWWFDKTDLSVINNIKKYNFSEDKVDEIIKNHNWTIPISIYMKYEPENFVWLIPTIQVNLRKNPNKDFESFKKSISGSSKQFEKLFEDFKIIEDFQEIEIAWIKSVYFKSSFDLLHQNWKKYNIISWWYAITKWKYFYQINFSDINWGDNSEIFEKLIKTVKFIEYKEKDYIKK